MTGNMQLYEDPEDSSTIENSHKSDIEKGIRHSIHQRFIKV